MTSNKKNKEDVFKITIITVNYNVSKFVNRMIDSLTLINKHVREIIIIDNNSIDKEEIRQNDKTKIIYNKKNVGFSKAVNQGILKAREDLILLINPDCYLENSSLLKSVKLIYMDKRIGAVGGKIKKHKSKNYQLTANNKANFFTGLFEFTILKKIFPNNMFSKSFWVENTKISQPQQVESLCGAYIIFRKKIDNKYNLFDERYFLYLEDVDFGNKIKDINYKVIFDPRSEITHFGGKSSNSKYNIVLNEWYLSRRKYFTKHLSLVESKILNTVFSIEETILKVFHLIRKTPYV
ncbi:MAG: glycosyltransferase family 2 protein [Candidatus Shapirobacteria bacterium]